MVCTGLDRQRVITAGILSYKKFIERQFRELGERLSVAAQNSFGSSYSGLSIFLPLELLGDASKDFSFPHQESYSDIAITYPGGAILRIGSAVDLDRLRTLLTLL